MAFADLDIKNVGDFIRCERDEAALWLFMHIPKTAGSSFSEAMQRFIPPYINVQVDYADASRAHNAKLDAAVDKFLADFRCGAVQSASGHMPFDLIDRIKTKIGNVKVVTFLRHPVSRVVSDFRYQRTPEHPPLPRVY